MMDGHEADKSKTLGSDMTNGQYLRDSFSFKRFEGEYLDYVDTGKHEVVEVGSQFEGALDDTMTREETG